MQEFQRRKRVKARTGPVWLIFVLIIAFFVLAKAAFNVWQKEKQSADQVAALTVSYADSQKRSDFLNSEIARLSTEKGVDEEIRQRFGMSKPDEKMIVIVDQESPQASSTPVKKGWWQKLLGL